MDPVPLSKIGTRLLASLGIKGKNRNPLACLRNAGSYFAITYCIVLCWIVVLEGDHGNSLCSPLVAIDFPWFDEDALISDASSESNSELVTRRAVILGK